MQGNFCAVKGKVWLSTIKSRAYVFLEGGVMKMPDFFEPVRITVMIAFAVGMGIAFHQVFFMVGLVLAILAFIHIMGQRLDQAKPTHRHA
jgi:uncharacterized membrane protein